MRILLACMYVTIYIQYPFRTEEEVGLPGTGVSVAVSCLVGSGNRTQTLC